MAKGSRRNRTEGVLDRGWGRVTETFGRLTGRKRHQAKGRSLRLRGAARTRKGRAKRRGRRVTS
jgi:uncharacterized protein YjbJ (UPF0337 family)